MNARAALDATQPIAKTLEAVVNHLTRIRPNFWVFQEKCPFFGSNPVASLAIAQ